MITGGTSGIGLALSKALSCLGADVTIVGRSPEKCAAVAGQISSISKRPVEWIAADLSLLAGIHQVAVTYQQREARLHILVNNAGGIFLKRVLTKDGLEMTFALNHLSYFLLTNLLLDSLKAGAPARVVCVASESHRKISGLNFENLQGKRSYRGMQAYRMSKLANILFTYELARRLPNAGITVNACHPGYVHTNIGANNRMIGPMIIYTARWFGRAPEEGARTAVYLAASPDVGKITAGYFSDCRQVPSSPLSYDEMLARKLWEISRQLTGHSIPRRNP